MLRGTVDGISPDEAVAHATLLLLRQLCDDIPAYSRPEIMREAVSKESHIRDLLNIRARATRAHTASPDPPSRCSLLQRTD